MAVTELHNGSATNIPDEGPCVSIDVATDADVPDLGTLGRALYAIYFAHLWSEAGFARFVGEQFDDAAMRADIADGRATWFLIRSGRETIGFAKITRDQPVPGSERTGALLEKIYLLPGSTGVGLGQQVLARLVDHAESQGAACIWIDVLKTNDRARRAYEKAGFEVTSEVPFSTDRHDIGFFVMCRAL